ncbi:MAG TPA: nuclear transport factor 2 family protein [Cyclobacteriaceae bacterium]|nr:nuclear transport factor 2 family protein [Cyclobacteriaceae bacterium]
MKKLFFLIFLLSGFAAQAQTEEDHVKAVIEKAYIGGIHNGGPVTDIRAGFHPTFFMYVLNKDEVKVTSIEEWVGNIEKSRAQNPNASLAKASAKFTSAIVSGSSASVVLELYRNDKKIFTDNLLLYKFPEGWRIVAKTFYRHPAS